MAKIKDKTFLGEQVNVGDLVVVTAKSGRIDFCWAVIGRLMGSSIMIQELEHPEVIRRVNDVLLVHVEDVEKTLGPELFKKYKELEQE